MQIGVPVCSAQEFLHAIALAVFVAFIRQFGRHLAVALAGRQHIVVMVGDANPLVGTLQRGKRPDQAPGGIWEDRTTQAGVHVLGKAFDVELDVADAAHAHHLHGDVAVVDVAELPDAGIGRQFLGVLLYERGDVHTADLLFALDGELDVAGQLGILRQQCVQREEPADKVAFVVADPAGEHHPVAA